MTSKRNITTNSYVIILMCGFFVYFIKIGKGIKCISIKEKFIQPYKRKADYSLLKLFPPMLTVILIESFYHYFAVSFLAKSFSVRVNRRIKFFFHRLRIF